MSSDIPKKRVLDFNAYGMAVFSIACIVFLSGYMVAEAKTSAVTSLYIDGAPESVVFIADPHIQEKGIDHLMDSIDVINSLEPSVVLIGGDFVNGDEENFTLQSIWSEIDAPVYAVLGNHDYRSGIDGINGQYKMLDVATKTDRSVDGYDMSPLCDDTTDKEFADSLEAALEEYGVNVLRNEYVDLTDSAGVPYRLVCMDDGWAGMSAPPDVPDSEMYTIYMIHEPECRADWDCDLILAGHTHGGQFTPPFVQILNENGIVELGGYFDSGTPLYITRGIGSSHLFGIEMRYQSEPEIVVINPRTPVSGSEVLDLR